MPFLFAGIPIVCAALPKQSYAEEVAVTVSEKPDSVVIQFTVPLTWVDVFRSMFRLLHLTSIFLPSAILYFLSQSFPELRQRWLKNFTIALECGGPTFIKLGQWASTRADLFPIDLCVALSKLHHQVAPLPANVCKRVIEESCSIPITEMFETFDDVPLGSGCIAQVHHATLKGSLRPVAVKIQRPGVSESINIDLLILRHTAAFFDDFHMFRHLRLPDVIENFSSLMIDQLSFKKEMEHLHRFRANFLNSDKFKHIVLFPEPIDSLSNEHVLVESFEKGLLLSELLNNAKDYTPDRLKQVGQGVLDVFLQMVFVDNFVHSDLHPGNILVNQQSQKRPSLVFLDAGLVTTLSDLDRQNFVDLVDAVVRGDGHQAARLMIERGHNQNRVIDPLVFEEGMLNIINHVRFTSFRLSKIKIGEVLSGVLNLARKHQVYIDPVFSNLIISIIVLEGVGRQLNPDVDLFQ
eukprot:c7171_g1_i2.p1 GENE.c7171_g1_i2~~c7171_g1_i2.p1  ORF type:complete len:529 (+),score=114.26 c7171_g1_i2:196-1587(+)